MIVSQAHSHRVAVRVDGTYSGARRRQCRLIHAERHKLMYNFHRGSRQSGTSIVLADGTHSLSQKEGKLVSQASDGLIYHALLHICNNVCTLRTVT